MTAVVESAIPSPENLVRIRIALLGALGQIAAASSSHAVEITVNAVSDTAAPGAPAGALWAAFYEPVIDDSGALAFGAVLQPGTGGVTVDDTYGVWRLDGSGWAHLARNGHPAPGVTDGAVFAPENPPPGGLGPPRLDGVGGLRVEGRLAAGPGGGFSGHPYGLWLAAPGQPLDLIVREHEQFGDDIVGAPSGQYAFNKLGETLFPAGHLWRVTGTGDPSVVIRYGDPVAGAPAGVTFSHVEPNRRLQINDAGAIAFQGLLGGTATIGNSSALFAAGPSGAVTLVARQGDPAAEIGGGAVYYSLGDISLDAVGRTAFTTWLKTGVGGVTDDNDVVFYGPAAIGSHTPLLREGDPAPGLPSGTLIRNLWYADMNEAGEMAVAGTLVVGPGGVTSDDDNAIWRVSATGDITVVARKGEVTPGLPDGAHVTGFGAVILNDAGALLFQVLFTPTPAYPDPDPEDPPPPPDFVDEAFYSADRLGHLSPLVREGDPIEVAPGDTRTVGTVFIFGDESFNDRGEFAVNAYFLEGGGSAVLTLPEPACGALAAGIALVAALARGVVPGRPRSS